MLSHQGNAILATPRDYTRPSVSEEDLLSFLLDPRSYPHQPQRVELIQTHAAYILLAPPYVYKVKKPVNLGFLDFSTLGNRLHFLKRELLLNTRLCPEIYLGIVPISMHEGTLTLGWSDTIVEFALKMKKLTNRYFMKERIKNGDIEYNDIDRIAETLKTFYTCQPSKKHIVQWGLIDKLKISTDENFQQSEKYIDWTVSRPAFETIRYYTEKFYVHRRALLNSRVQHGWIKDCHGDLHLDHIHLSPTSLCIYDCIEFNDRLRYIDVASDLAFLAMDLDFHGRRDLSRYFVVRMATLLNDPGLLPLIDFYKCYRAVVRGKVESLRSSEREVPEAEKKVSRKEAQRYFRLALQYATVGSRPTVLAIMGRVGTGKTTLANKLGEEFCWEVVSSDTIRKQRAGIPLFERSTQDVRARLYSDSMKQAVYDGLFDYAAQAIKKENNLIIDATFSQRRHRSDLKKLLTSLGASVFFIETTASDKTVKKRLLLRDDTALSDARIENFEQLRQRYEPPTELGSQETFSISTDDGAGIIGHVLMSMVLAHLLNDSLEDPHDA